jgi:hypothetical protein
MSTSGAGRVTRVTPVQTAVRNCTRDEGGPFEFGNQVLISRHRKLLWSKAMVVSVAEKSGFASSKEIITERVVGREQHARKSRIVVRLFGDEGEIVAPDPANLGCTPSQSRECR